MNPHPLLNRRRFLTENATALSGIALAQLLQNEDLLGATSQLRESTSGKTPIRPDIDSSNPNAPRRPHFDAEATNVLMIFCAGACSPLDTFDYKPDLIKYHGQPMPGGDKLITFQGEQGNLTKSPWESPSFPSARSMWKDDLGSNAAFGSFGR